MPSPLSLTASAKADAAGNVVISFVNTLVRDVWIGTVAVVNSPPQTEWTVTAGSQQWGSAIGAQAIVIQATDTYQPVTVAAANLVPGQIYTAQLIGSQYVLADDLQVPWASPYPSAPSPTGTTPGPGGGGGQIVPPTPVPQPPPTTPGVEAFKSTHTVVSTGGGTKIVDPANYGNGIRSFTISNPEGQLPIWVAYGDVPLINYGIEIPSPGFLFENDWPSSVFAICATGSQPVGVQVLTPA